ncbi:flavin reductase family protein [Streptomyces sp. NBC_01381]|uniref:flavin reductase family protein n=1 Tax=Streptomyces sp. NBC_01381 TaxID=2903845 RepID=UPI002254A135|nr:flavin reductase family protein [Streptomyces sp. NBC_01381]MCX4673481.1 flavin reductase family protein [Streptomyces sp. NBC_01381]
MGTTSPARRHADMEAPPVSSGMLRNVLREVPTAVTVVTATTGDRPAGLTVGSFVSVSLDPPLIGIFVDEKSSSWPEMRNSATFTVNVLSGDQQELCARFAASGRDKFAGLPLQKSPLGNPLLPGIAAWLDCRVVEVRKLGDHHFALARVAGLGTTAATTSIVFHRGTLHAIP